MAGTARRIFQIMRGEPAGDGGCNRAAGYFKSNVRLKIMLQRGRVQHWREEGWGFIRPDTGAKDVFFHRNECCDSTPPEIGDLVEYQLSQGRDGRVCATNVLRI